MERLTVENKINHEFDNLRGLCFSFNDASTKLIYFNESMKKLKSLYGEKEQKVKNELLAEHSYVSGLREAHIQELEHKIKKLEAEKATLKKELSDEHTKSFFPSEFDEAMMSAENDISNLSEKKTTLGC